MNKKLFFTTYCIAAATIIASFLVTIIKAYQDFPVMPWYALLQIFLILAPIAFAWAHGVYLGCTKNPKSLQ